jgi:drug/metabolite transporter (DMT)-like permease
MSKLILDLYSPVTFYFLRCFAVLLISFIIFRPKLSNIENKLKWHMLLVGAIWVVYRVVTYYGYIKIGIISTTLILMLSPIFVYSFASIFLKEKINVRNIISSAIILVCVLYASFT